MNTKDIIKYAALAVAAYLVYKYLKESGILGGAPVVVTPSVTTQPPVTVQPGEITVPPAQVAVKPPPASALQQRVLNRALASGIGPTQYLNYDQWNYYYQAETGSYAPAFELVLPGVERAVTMPLEAFFQQIERYGTEHGLSGLAGSLAALAAMRAGNAWIV